MILCSSVFLHRRAEMHCTPTNPVTIMLGHIILRVQTELENTGYKHAPQKRNELKRVLN